VRRGRDACQAVANCLLLDPDNHSMHRNKLFYKEHYGNDPELFQADPVSMYRVMNNRLQKLVEYHRRAKHERQFLDFIDHRFRYDKSGAVSECKAFVEIDDQLPPEQADDHYPIDLEISLEDNFDYSRLDDAVLEHGECLHLYGWIIGLVRSPAIRAALESRLETLELRDRSRFSGLRCLPHSRAPSCAHGRTLAVSLDRSTCGQIFEASFHVGCAALFCPGKVH
jgi:ferredoxin